MKKCLLLPSAILAVAPAAWGYKVAIPSLEVDGKMVPRSVYSKIQISPGTPGEEKTEPSLRVGDGNPISRSLYNKLLITAGTPAVEETGPSLKVAGQEALSRSVYNKIYVDADAGTYTLVSDDPTAAPGPTYSFQDSPQISVGTDTYTVTPAVSGTYTLTSADSKAEPMTYSFDAAPQVSVMDHTYTTPGESGTFTLVSNNPDKYDHLTYSFEDQPQVLLATEYKDYITSVESIASEDENLMTYHSATQTLRADWAESREVRIINVGGQTVLAGRLGGADRILSVATLPAGVYVVSARGKQALKFIKQ